MDFEPVVVALVQPFVVVVEALVCSHFDSDCLLSGHFSGIQLPGAGVGLEAEHFGLVWLVAAA